MTHDPDPKPRGRHDVDVERGSATEERAPARETGTSRTVEPEDEDRRVRPGEKRPQGTMP
ncbi:MAG: hypothetical protein HQ465_10255 [Rhodospirillales bacterium]|nr:hypothetical protein [Rhodospirillales bacterium]